MRITSQKIEKKSKLKSYTWSLSNSLKYYQIVYRLKYKLCITFSCTNYSHCLKLLSMKKPFKSQTNQFHFLSISLRKHTINPLIYDLRSRILTPENVNKLALPSSRSHNLCSTMTRTIPVIFTFGPIIYYGLCP